MHFFKKMQIIFFIIPLALVNLQFQFLKRSCTLAGLYGKRGLFESKYVNQVNGAQQHSIPMRDLLRYCKLGLKKTCCVLALYQYNKVTRWYVRNFFFCDKRRYINVEHNTSPFTTRTRKKQKITRKSLEILFIFFLSSPG